MDQSGYFPAPRRQLSGPAAPGVHPLEQQHQRQYGSQPHDSANARAGASGYDHYPQQQPPPSSEHHALEPAPLSAPAGGGPSQYSQSHHRQDSLHLDAGAHSHQHYDTSELHMPGLSPIDHHHTSPQDPPFAPHRPPTLTFNQPLSDPGAVGAAYTQQHAPQQPQLSPLHPPQRPQTEQFANSVPNVLQPAGGASNRPQPVPSNTAPTIPTIQHPQPPPASLNQQSRAASGSAFLQSSDAPPKNTLDTNMAHAYSRSSPAAGYDGPPSYHSYTPTTPGGGPASANHFMSPSDMKYTAPGSQRNISNTPLGLADIRPRADSSMSDSGAAALGYEQGHTQPGTSNYLAPWAIYAFDWCKWAPQGNGAGKLAVGSYLEDGHNFIQILDSHLAPTPQDVYQPGSSKYSLEFNKVAEATHSYPVTRLLWEPPSSQKQSTDLLATSGDHLRLWSLPSDTPATPGSSINNRGRDQPTTKLTPLALLSNSKTPDHTAPLTSLDWNTVSPSLIITSSIDTTCTIWDIPSLTAKTQLIAHDKEVYDVRFCANSVDVFVSCGQDGSVRMFDLRSLEHSTIIYEPTGKDDKDAAGRASPTTAQQTMSNPPPLLRLATSPHDTHLLATFAQDSGVIRILDVRQPGQALLELRGHSGAINCLEWSPLRRGTLASGGDDCQVLLWDLLNSNAAPGAPINGGPQQDGGRSPVASWECEYEIGNLGWVPHLQGTGDAGEWLGVSAGRGIWGTRVM